MNLQVLDRCGKDAGIVTHEAKDFVTPLAKEATDRLAFMVVVDVKESVGLDRSAADSTATILFSQHPVVFLDRDVIEMTKLPVYVAPGMIQAVTPLRLGVGDFPSVSTDVAFGYLQSYPLRPGFAHTLLYRRG